MQRIKIIKVKITSLIILCAIFFGLLGLGLGIASLIAAFLGHQLSFVSVPVKILQTGISAGFLNFVLLLLFCTMSGIVLGILFYFPFNLLLKLIKGIQIEYEPSTVTQAGSDLTYISKFLKIIYDTVRNNFPHTILIVVLILSVYTDELSFLQAVIVYLFGFLAIFCARRFFTAVNAGDTLGIETHWGGLGGNMGGWNISKSVTYLLAAVIFGIMAIIGAAHFEKSKTDNALSQNETSKEVAEQPKNKMKVE
jgi:hypothetical protein